VSKPDELHKLREIQTLGEKASLEASEAGLLFAHTRHEQARAALMRALYLSDRIRRINRPKRRSLIS